MASEASGYYRETLKGCEVIYRNKTEFDLKHAAMVRDGRDGLQVISDFDFTLTRYYQADGESRSASCHMVLEHSTGLLPENYLIAAKELQLYYYPIEQDPTMDPDIKFQHMEDWVNKHNVLFMDCGLTEDIIQTAVVRAYDTGKFRLRDGLEHMISMLYDANVPLLIFSAGITNVLEFALQSALAPTTSDGTKCIEPLPSNINIISNRCLFETTSTDNDDGATTTNVSGALIGFSTPVLHVYNKSCHAFRDTNPHFPKSIHRKNVLLFGDSLGDIKMSQGYEDNINNIIKIGFINDKIKANEQLNTYLLESNYDMVIMGDPSLDVHQHLLERILYPVTTSASTTRVSATV